MRVFSAKVVGRSIVVEGEPLPDGATVIVVTREPGDDFTVSTADEAELLSRIACVDAGDTIEEKELFARLRDG